MDSNSSSTVFTCGHKASLVEQLLQAHTDVCEELRQVEETLCRTQAELAGYRTLYENTPSICFTLNAAGVVLAVNQFGATRLGYSITELIKKSIFSLFVAEDRPALQAEFVTFLQQVAPAALPLDADLKLGYPLPGLSDRIAQWEFRLLDKTQRPLWVQVTARVVQPTDANLMVLFACEDITECKQTRLRLNLLEQALLSSSSSVLITDPTQPDNPIVYVNPKFEQVTGYTAAEAMGRNCRFLHGTDTEQPALQDLRTALQQEQECQVVLRNYRKDGTLFWNELHISPIRDAEGQLINFVGIQTDITERKTAEIAFQQQIERERLIGSVAQRIRQSLNLGTILNTTVTEVQKLLQANRVLICRIWPDSSGSVVTEAVAPGYSKLVGRNFSAEVFPKSSRDLYCQGRIRAIHDISDGSLSPCLVEFLQQFQVRSKLVVPILQHDQLWGLLITHHCCGPRQWQQAEIELLEQLATQVAIAIQQSELYQEVKLLNANLEYQVQERTAQLQQALMFEAMLKRITDKVRDSLDENQIVQTAVQELALGLGVECCDAGLYNKHQGKSTIRYEYTTRLASMKGQELQMADYPGIYDQLLRGQHFQFCKLHCVRGWISILACPMFAGNSNPETDSDLGVLGDLWLFKPRGETFTELEIRLVQQVANQCAIAIRQARLYQAAQTQVTELEKLHCLKDDFLSTVSHELRTPVSNMKVAIQMLELSMQQNSDPSTETLRSPQISGQKVARYLQILQDECRREISLINNLLDLQRLDAGGQALNLTMIQLQGWLNNILVPFEERTREHQQHLKVEIFPNIPRFASDTACLGRILTELLNNACKYTPASETITLQVQAQGDRLQIQVSNSGVEIPAKELERVFEKFYRIPNGDPWKHGGTGLGLALTKKLAEHLGGSIQVTSQDNQVCFTVELPIRETI